MMCVERPLEWASLSGSRRVDLGLLASLKQRGVLFGLDF